MSFRRASPVHAPQGLLRIARRDPSQGRIKLWLRRLARTMPSLYELLDVAPSASTEEVRVAYKTKAMSAHPDRGGDEESFRLLSKAYDVLSDSERRKYYERTGRPERTAEDDFLDGFGKKSVETPKRDESAALAQRLDASHEESHATSFEAWMRSRRPRRLCCWRLRETASPSTCRQRVYVNLTWSRR